MGHHSRERILYVGGYAASHEQGVHIVTLDSSTGQLEIVRSVSGVKNPSFLALHHSAHMLYAVSESGAGAEIVSLHIEPDSLNMTVLDRQPCSGAGPCHVTVSPSGRFVLAASYQGGSVSVFPLSETGRLEAEIRHVRHGGPDDPARDTDGHRRTPHPHQVVFTPSGSRVCVPDLGLDRVYVYQLDEESGQLLFHRAHRLQDGDGPRHMAFHPHKPYAYTINELASTVTAFRHSDDGGELRRLQTVTALPADFVGESYAADIHIDRTGLIQPTPHALTVTRPTCIVASDHR